MKRLIMVFTVIAAIAILSGSVTAEKRLDVMLMSNGYPSGEHFNLNIHGKDLKDTQTFDCSETEGGNSVFVAENGDSTIEYVWNKKATHVTELTVLDSCAECFDRDPATVQVPYEQEGYYIFYRLRGKPNNSYETAGDPSSVMLIPNPVLKVCNDTDPANPDFPNYTDCPDGDDEMLMALGMVTTQGVYRTVQTGLFRFDSSEESKGNGKGKGNSKATDITDLFQWSGYVCKGSLDTNGDGILDTLDVPAEYDTNGDGVIDSSELSSWLDLQVSSGMCEVKSAWVWDIADLVVQSTTVSNDGAKLLKIRWYPVDTTSYR
jgi:hypothetical protein